MLTHRLMIAKRLYSILKRNVINRFVRAISFFSFFIPFDLLWHELCFNTETRLPYCLKFSFHSLFLSVSSYSRFRFATIYFLIFVVRLILLILFLCDDAWENALLGTVYMRTENIYKNCNLEFWLAMPIWLRWA